MFKNIMIHLDYLGVDSIDDVFDYKFLNRFIFSDRLTYLKEVRERYYDSKFFSKVLGIGYTYLGKEDKVIEMDFLDILYRAGILGFIIFIIPWFIWLKGGGKVKFNIILALGIAFLAGHVLTSPSGGFILGMIMNNKGEEEI